MKIAFDIDGVLTDIEKFQLEYGRKFFKKKYNRDIVNPKGYSIRKIFDCTKEQEYDFWKHYILYYSLKYPARIGAKEVLIKLSRKYQIEILSSRIKTSEKGILGSIMRLFLKHWLKVRKISYDNISFCSVENSALEKTKYCKENNIDVIIEDSPDNIEELLKVTKVICYNASYNQSLEENQNLYRVNHFYKICDIINEIDLKKSFMVLNREEKDKMSHIDLIEYYYQLRNYYAQFSNLKKIEKTEKTYRHLYPIIKKVFDFKFPYEIRNSEKIPNYNGVIYVANHRDMIDPPLVMSILGNRPIHLLLKAEFLHHPAAKFLQQIGCIFVDRQNKDSHIVSKEQLIQLILSGSNCIIFPEGTRNKTSDLLLDFKLGAVSIAQITGAPIVPIAIKKEFDDYSEKIILEVGDKIFVGVTDDLIEKNNEVKENIKNMLSKPKTKTL